MKKVCFELDGALYPADFNIAQYGSISFDFIFLDMIVSIQYLFLVIPSLLMRLTRKPNKNNVFDEIHS